MKRFEQPSTAVSNNFEVMKNFLESTTSELKGRSHRIKNNTISIDGRHNLLAKTRQAKEINERPKTQMLSTTLTSFQDRFSRNGRRKDLQSVIGGASEKIPNKVATITTMTSPFLSS